MPHERRMKPRICGRTDETRLGHRGHMWCGRAGTHFHEAAAKRLESLARCLAPAMHSATDGHARQRCAAITYREGL
jgi:hypothetical protein